MRDLCTTDQLSESVITCVTEELASCVREQMCATEPTKRCRLTWDDEDQRCALTDTHSAPEQLGGGSGAVNKVCLSFHLHRHRHLNIRVT